MGKMGSMEVRSLYFDNLEDKALREKLDGVNIRKNTEFVCIITNFR